ncbi:PTS fructose transporter subunit IIBC [Pullulanibacillus camelliae]|uniref:PTS fructose transporter subunit IIBC n=1 Tax=Pullulanibacillus camelliae TaxID=1707096 RepID=A0A8J2VDI1_9BACL|nr:fructose-specific PTS transporter subunit EIIC [Pullulanibacillus camelliae]GGE27570.1 PTS fructose transporter subunit IIBC [Pullulanibacillus camelliae]
MKIVAITSCSTGIAHTYMAAESLEMAAKELHYEIKVETQGSIGVENKLSERDIEEADVVIIAATTTVNKDRFFGKRLNEVNIDEAIHDAKTLIQKSLKEAKIFGNASTTAHSSEQAPPQKGKKGLGPYRHLMTGVSYMIPFVVTGGILIALSFAFGGIHAADHKGTLAASLNQIGSGTAFALMLPILAGFIAFSIADRPGIVPGMIGGMLASTVGAGFFGALIAGFLAGYIALYLRKSLKLPKALQGLIPVLILPLISSLITGLLMIYVVGEPFKALNTFMTDWLNGLSGTNSIILGVIIGGMMAVDMAGPVGKAAYFFGVASLTGLHPGETSIVMAATMASGMVPPLGMAFATFINKKKFTKEEQEAGKTAWILGISFITEGAIPFAAADPLRVIPSSVIGAAVTGALSMLFKCGLAVPHGGIFVLPIPGAVSHVFLYMLAILIGACVTAIIAIVLKSQKVEHSNEGNINYGKTEGMLNRNRKSGYDPRT